MGNYSYTNSSHVDAATAIGGTAWTAVYDASGDLTCRAPSSATTCLESSPISAQLADARESRLQGAGERTSKRPVKVRVHSHLFVLILRTSHIMCNDTPPRAITEARGSGVLLLAAPHRQEEPA